VVYALQTEEHDGVPHCRKNGKRAATNAVLYALDAKPPAAVSSEKLIDSWTHFSEPWLPGQSLRFYVGRSSLRFGLKSSAILFEKSPMQTRSSRWVGMASTAFVLLAELQFAGRGAASSERNSSQASSDVAIDADDIVASSQAPTTRSGSGSSRKRRFGTVPRNCDHNDRGQYLLPISESELQSLGARYGLWTQRRECGARQELALAAGSPALTRGGDISGSYWFRAERASKSAFPMTLSGSPLRDSHAG